MKREPRFRANALISETSPYLQQHAYNPVDWLPWGELAFERARLEDRPIFLSIGYSSCHWCHVMERESFEDEEIAQLINTSFVPVKVDREERPDVDAVYMTAVQLVSGTGGWPMTVFLTPSGDPFYAGTYFPPTDRYGRPGLRRVLLALDEAWRERRAEVLQSAAGLTSHLKLALRGVERTTSTETEVDLHRFDRELAQASTEHALGILEGRFDPIHGGFGRAPKFPNPGLLNWLLDRVVRIGDARALEFVQSTLKGLGRGGIRDHLGGGFARYSTDETWLVPHFEKMLYDNAQLAKVFLRAYLLDGDSNHLLIAEETLAYVLREMTDAQGGFYSAQDADSEGIEGKFFVWKKTEIEAELGEEAPLFCRAYGVTEQGNWEGRNVLYRALDGSELAKEFNVDPIELEQRLAASRVRLFSLRATRIRPALDDKVIVAWNGLMLEAFALAARVFGPSQGLVYLEAAERNVAFVREWLYAEGRLWHTYRAGVAKVPGLLEDYALYAQGLLELYRTTFKREYLEFAVSLAETANTFFQDPDAPGWFDTPSDGETLITRPKSLFEGAMPSGNGAMALLLWRLSRLYGRFEWEARAVALTQSLAKLAAEEPFGFSSPLSLFEVALAPRHEVAIIGDLADSRTEELLAVVHDNPFLTLALGKPGETDPPLLEGRGLVGGAPAAYVCEDFICDLPVTSAWALCERVKR